MRQAGLGWQRRWMPQNPCCCGEKCVACSGATPSELSVAISGQADCGNRCHLYNGTWVLAYQECKTGGLTYPWGLQGTMTTGPGQTIYIAEYKYTNAAPPLLSSIEIGVRILWNPTASKRGITACCRRGGAVAVWGCCSPEYDDIGFGYAEDGETPISCGSLADESLPNVAYSSAGNFDCCSRAATSCLVSAL
jgi:hypothetical protein